MGIEYWLQSSDFSSVDDSAESISDILSIFRQHNWAQEEEQRQSLEASGADCCDAGLGIMHAVGSILHLCPIDGREVLAIAHSIRTRKVRRDGEPVLVDLDTHLTWRDAEKAISYFVDGEFDALIRMFGSKD